MEEQNEVLVKRSVELEDAAAKNAQLRTQLDAYKQKLTDQSAQMIRKHT